MKLVSHCGTFCLVAFALSGAFPVAFLTHCHNLVSDVLLLPCIFFVEFGHDQIGFAQRKHKRTDTHQRSSKYWNLSRLLAENKHISHQLGKVKPFKFLNLPESSIKLSLIDVVWLPVSLMGAHREGIMTSEVRQYLLLYRQYYRRTILCKLPPPSPNTITAASIPYTFSVVPILTLPTISHRTLMHTKLPAF